MKKNNMNEILFNKNKVVLTGIFAWLFYANTLIWFLSTILKIFVTLMK